MHDCDISARCVSREDAIDFKAELLKEFWMKCIDGDPANTDRPCNVLDHPYEITTVTRAPVLREDGEHINEDGAVARFEHHETFIREVAALAVRTEGLSVPRFIYLVAERDEVLLA